MKDFVIISVATAIGLAVTILPQHQDAKVREALLEERNRQLHEEAIKFNGYRQAIQDSN